MEDRIISWIGKPSVFTLVARPSSIGIPTAKLPELIENEHEMPKE
jgi:hypothetical protein